ncbi:MAG: Fe-Mn family superoxide dismutase [Chlamydiota bacterium]
MKKWLFLGLAASSLIHADFVAKDYSFLKGTPGFSDEALNLHFTLYQGYVKNSNLILKELDTLQNNRQSPEYSELKRRFGWEFDGMRLHEYYFENMGGKDPLSTESPLYKQIVQDFGSYDKWREDFIATGSMLGIGWAILYLDPISKRLFNVWINEHDLGHLAGGKPLLIMDVFEHAYIPDYQLQRAKYIEAFFMTVRWPVVESRFGLL